MKVGLHELDHSGPLCVAEELQRAKRRSILYGAKGAHWSACDSATGVESSVRKSQYPNPKASLGPVCSNHNMVQHYA